MRERVIFLVIALCVACVKKDAAVGSKRGSMAHDSSATVAPIGIAPGGPRCPATGLWAECSVLYRLDRAGIAPHLEPNEKVQEKSLGTGATTFVMKIGASARLEVFLYPDSTTRVADEAKLDRTQFVGATSEQTIKRERTLIENANLVGLLTSINSHQRERVSDALTAGAPQPHDR